MLSVRPGPGEKEGEHLNPPRQPLDLQEGIKAARAALAAGELELLAYVLGEDVEDVRRVCGQ